MILRLFANLFCMKIREIEKEPDVPELSVDQIKILTDLCFRADDVLEPADLIFVFGSYNHVQELAGIISDLLSKKLSNKVFITGGLPNYVDSAKINKAESLLVLDLIDQRQFEGVKFYTEDKSLHTTGNVTEALRVLDFSDYKRIIYIFKSHTSGRGYLTLKKYLPNAKLMQKTFNACYHDGQEVITRENWYKTALGRKRVWGDYLRIKKYSERGDIAKPEGIKWF